MAALDCLRFVRGEGSASLRGALVTLATLTRLEHWDGAASRYRIVSADVGDGGIMPDVPYVVRDRKLVRKDGAP